LSVHPAQFAGGDVNGAKAADQPAHPGARSIDMTLVGAIDEFGNRVFPAA
jgi:hypothetical protein